MKDNDIGRERKMDIDILSQLEGRLEAVERENAALRGRVDSLESDVRMIGDVNSLKRRMTSAEYHIERLHRSKLDDLTYGGLH